jgi:hypothetical protein
MGRLVVNNAVTVNGAFEAPAPDPDGWLVLDADSNQVSLEQFLVADAMVLGRRRTRDSRRSGRNWPTTPMRQRSTPRRPTELALPPGCAFDDKREPAADRVRFSPYDPVTARHLGQCQCVSRPIPPCSRSS